MKKFFAFAVTFIMVGTACFAQDKRNDHKRHDNWEAIKAEKIGFITSKLDLSVEEAQAFWPVYNAYMKEISSANRKVSHNLWSLKAKKDEVIPDKEMVERINAYVAAKIDADAVFEKYSKEFLTVLPAEKVGRLYLAEEQFNRNMVNKLVDRKIEKKTEKRERPEMGGKAPADRSNAQNLR